MSPAQTTLYWRLWRKACAAQGWAKADRDRRMSVHRQCLGRELSMKVLTNKQLDLVYAQFRLLIDADDLDAQITIDCPAGGQLERVMYSLGKCPAELVLDLCRDKFDRANFRTLNLTQATQLLMTVKRVLRHRDTKAAADPSPDDDGLGVDQDPRPEPAVVAANCPF